MSEENGKLEEGEVVEETSAEAAAVEETPEAVTEEVEAAPEPKPNLRDQITAKVRAERNSQNPEPDEDPTPAVEPEQYEPLITLVVDGVEQQVPQSQVLEAGKRAAQIEAAAQKRMQEAAAQKKALEEARAKIEAERQQVHQETEEEKQALLDEQAEAIANDIYSGDIDTAREAVKKLMSQTAHGTESSTLEQRMREIANETATARALKQDEERAREVFMQDYREVLQDEDLFGIANAEVERVIAENPGISRVEAVKRGGEKAIAARDRFASKANPRITDVGQDRLAAIERAKANAARSSASRTAQTVQKPRTRSDVIAEYASRRAGAVR